MATALIRINLSLNEKEGAQRRRVNAYAKKIGITIEQWDIKEVSDSASVEQLNTGLLSSLKPKAKLVVPWLSILGKDLEMVVDTLDKFVQKGAIVHSAKEELVFKNDSNLKVLISAFRAAVNIDKDIIQLRIKKGLLKKKLSGKAMGRPKGSLSEVRKLSGKEEEIKKYLGKKVSVSATARILGVHRHTLGSFLKNR